MKPILDPKFDQVTARLPLIRWAASSGQALSPAIASWCAPIADTADALRLLNSDDWEVWSADRQQALSSYLSLHHKQRFLDWNPVARRAKEVVDSHKQAITLGLITADLNERIVADTVEWDLIAALTCAAFLDCRPPIDELRLLDVYEAGHLPIGWNSESRRVLVY